MKHFLLATVVASVLMIEPAVAGSMSDPALDQDIVAQAATADASANIDGVMLALLYVVFLMAVGGAF